MFDWYKKDRLDEQLKFFGGKRKSFVSCYSKAFRVKPRIVVKVKVQSLLVCNDNNRNYIVSQANRSLLGNMGLGGGLAGLQAMGAANTSQLQLQGAANMSALNAQSQYDWASAVNCLRLYR